jgi:Inositol monophosphatase family
MRRISTLVVAALCTGIFSLHKPAQAGAEISLLRLADCGTPQAPVPVNERRMRFSMSPWDTLAGTLLVEEAGGLVTTFARQQRPMDQKIDILATNGHLHNDVSARLSSSN